MTHSRRGYAAVGLVLAVAVAYSAAADEDTLQGTWQVKELIHDGKPSELPEGAQLTIAKDGMTFTAPGEKKGEFTFKLDPAKKPRAIDVMPLQGPKGESLAGIYELKGDTLKLWAWFKGR